MEQAAAVREPFWWAVHLPEKTGVGKTLALLLHSMFRSASDFGDFIDILPHGDSQHLCEGFACFKCMLKAMHLATDVAKNGTELVKLFDEICDKWSVDLSIQNELVWYLLIGLDSWAKEDKDFDCPTKLYRLFRFDTHVKWGCYHCKDHFSSSSSQYLFEVGGRTLELYLRQLTTEIWRRCSRCQIETGYDRVKLGSLPVALIFANAASPLIHMKIEEEKYKISVVIPKISKLVAFVLTGEGWFKITLKEAATVSECPSFANALKGEMDYVFYSRI